MLRRLIKLQTEFLLFTDLLVVGRILVLPNPICLLVLLLMADSSLSKQLTIDVTNTRKKVTFATVNTLMVWHSWASYLTKAEHFSFYICRIINNVDNGMDFSTFLRISIAHFSWVPGRLIRGGAGGFHALNFCNNKNKCVYNKHTINVGIVIVGFDIVLEYPRMAQRSTPEGVLVPVVPGAM